MARYHERASERAALGWHLIDPVGPAVRGADLYVLAITIGRRISKYHDRSERGCGCGKGPAASDRSCPRISLGISARISPLAYFTTDFLRYPPVKILARAFLAFSADRAAAAAAEGWRTGSQGCYRSVFSSIVPPRRVQMRVSLPLSLSLSLSLSNTVGGPAN